MVAELRKRGKITIHYSFGSNTVALESIAEEFSAPGARVFDDLNQCWNYDEISGEALDIMEDVIESYGRIASDAIAGRFQMAEVTCEHTSECEDGAYVEVVDENGDPLDEEDERVSQLTQEVKEFIYAESLGWLNQAMPPSSEPRYKTGEVLLSHNQAVLLQALARFPGGRAPSIRSLIDAAKGTRGNLARGARSLHRDWVKKERNGRALECQLTERGWQIMRGEVKARVRGRGPFRPK